MVCVLNNLQFLGCCTPSFLIPNNIYLTNIFVEENIAHIESAAIKTVLLFIAKED
jgi:hypothetical protein